jgi:hypothetical protein
MTAADTDMVVGEGRRPSIEKKPIALPDTDHAPDKECPAFERLPDEIIQQYAPSLVSLSSLLSGVDLNTSCFLPGYSPSMTGSSR